MSLHKISLAVWLKAEPPKINRQAKYGGLFGNNVIMVYNADFGDNCEALPIQYLLRKYQKYMGTGQKVN